MMPPPGSADMIHGDEANDARPKDEKTSGLDLSFAITKSYFPLGPQRLRLTLPLPYDRLYRWSPDRPLEAPVNSAASRRTAAHYVTYCIARKYINVVRGSIAAGMARLPATDCEQSWCAR